MSASTGPIGDGEPVLGTIIRDTQQSSQALDHGESELAGANADAESRSRPPSPPPKQDGSSSIQSTPAAPPSSPPQRNDFLPATNSGSDSASPPSTGRTRPPSRPPSLSRPPSVYRPRSSSSVSRLSTSGGVPGSNAVYGGPGTALPEPKRLSVSSTGGGGGHLPPVSSPSTAGQPPPSSPSLASSGAPVSPRIPEDSTTASNASTDETTPSPPPPAAVKESFSPLTSESSTTRDAISPSSSSAATTTTAAAGPDDGAAYHDGRGTEAVRPDPAAAAAAAWKSPTLASESVDTEVDEEADEEQVEIVVVVRDYAFPRDDPRFEGRMLPEEIAAAAERKRFRDQEEEERGGAAWLVDRDGSVLVGGGGGGLGAAASGAGAAGPSFHWGFVTSHAADFPGSEVEDDDDDDFDATGSRHRGYAFHDPTHGDGFGDYADDAGFAGGDGENDGEEEEDLGEFVPGVYSAVYAFEPELETEMRLLEGELVSVFERQCRGWVQAGRIVDNVVIDIGLVPENYLALVEPHEGVVDWSTQDGEAEGHPAAAPDKEEVETKGTNTAAATTVAEKSGLVDGEPQPQPEPPKSTETAAVAAA